MHRLYFIVQNQNIVHCPGRPLVAHSKGHVYAHFTFDEEWSDLSIVAIFKHSDVPEAKTVLLTDNIAAVPPEVLVNGHLNVSLVGYGNQGTVRIPTISMGTPLRVYRSGDLIGIPPEQSTPELWEQLLAIVGPVSKLDTTEKSSIVAAINELCGRTNGSSGIYFGSGEMPPNCAIQVDFDANPDTVFDLGEFDALQSKIQQKVIDALGTPIYGTVDIEKNIDLSGDLVDGEYTLSYINADGSKTAIATGTIENGTFTVKQ